VLGTLVLHGLEVDVDDLVLGAHLLETHTSTRATFVDIAGPNTFTGAIAFALLYALLLRSMPRAFRYAR
jgi:Arc/MetJ family transcription regulator